MNLETLNEIFGKGLNFKEGVGYGKNVFTLTIIGTQSIYVRTVGDKIQVMCNFNFNASIAPSYHKTDIAAADAIRSLFYRCVQDIFDLRERPESKGAMCGHHLVYMGRDSIAEMLERDGIEGIRESIIAGRDVRDVSLKLELLFATGGELSMVHRHIIQSIARFLLDVDKEQIASSSTSSITKGVAI